MRTRKEARERAFQLLFQLEIQHDDEAGQVDRFLDVVTYAPKDLADDDEMNGEFALEAGRPVSKRDKEFIRDVVDYVRAHRDELDAIYTPFLKGWTLERLPLVDRCILRLACYEITQRADVPFNVTVSEAVLLANKYADAEARPYINAVLGRLKKFACPKDDRRAKAGQEGALE